MGIKGEHQKINGENPISFDALFCCEKEVKMKQPNIKNYDDLPLFINAELLAQVFGISRASAYELMREKDFPSFRIGKRIFVTKENLISWIENNAKGR